MSTTKNNRRELIDYNKAILYIWTVILFVIFSLLAFGIISIFANIQTEQNRSEFVLEKEISIEGTAASIQETLSYIADNLLVLSEYMLAIPLAESFDDSRSTVEQMFINLAEITQKFDQIRFIDAEGMEQVRINYNYGARR